MMDAHSTQHEAILFNIHFLESNPTTISTPDITVRSSNKALSAVISVSCPIPALLRPSLNLSIGHQERATRLKSLNPIHLGHP
jgi:hypothetical protein